MSPVKYFMKQNYRHKVPLTKYSTALQKKYKTVKTVTGLNYAKYIKNRHIARVIIMHLLIHSICIKNYEYNFLIYHTFNMLLLFKVLTFLHILESLIIFLLDNYSN